MELSGGCHCKTVRFSLEHPSTPLNVYRCNCSVCVMKQNHHFCVPKSKFKLYIKNELVDDGVLDDDSTFSGASEFEESDQV